MADDISPASGKKQPQHWRLKVTGIMCSYAAVGMVDSLPGPTLIDMEEYLGTDTTGMAMTSTLGSLGYVCGSALCGYVYYRFQLELQFLFETVILGILVAASPWSRNLVAFGALRILCGMAGGLIDATGQGYLIYLMSGHRLLNPVMQFSQAMMSLGAFIGPFFIGPFLSAKEFQSSSHSFTSTSVLINLTDKDVTVSSMRMLNTTATLSFRTNFQPARTTSVLGMLNTSLNLTDIDSHNTSPERVPFCFLVIGTTAVIFAAPILAAFMLEQNVCIIKNTSDAIRHSNTDSPKETSRYFRVTLHFLLFFWFFFGVALEQVTGTFIASYVVRELKWSRDRGPLISSVLWGTQGIGSVLAVPTAVVASPRQMLVASVTLSTAAFAVLLTSTGSHALLVWISVGMIGVGISSCFTSMVVWTSRQLHVGGQTTAVLNVGGSLGSMLSVALTGYLFQYYSPIWMMYIGLAASLLDIVIYMLAEAFVYFHNSSSNADIKPISFKRKPREDCPVE